MSYIIKIGIPLLIAHNMTHTVSHVVLNVTAVEGNNINTQTNNTSLTEIANRPPASGDRHTHSRCIHTRDLMSKRISTFSVICVTETKVCEWNKYECRFEMGLYTHRDCRIPTTYTSHKTLVFTIVT